MSRSGGSRSRRMRDGDGEAICGNHCVRDDEDTRIEVGDDDGKSRERRGPDAGSQGHDRRRGGTVAARPRKSGQRAFLGRVIQF
ncbi:unnamed protein product, partial [Brassica oleracea]